MVMRQMRNNTKWIMLVTALAFVALMVFEWGMDITGRSAGGMGEIGRVNSQPVMYEDYMTVYRNLYDQVQQQQEEPLTSAQVSQLEDAAWENVVEQILVRQELERRGIRVTDDEIRNAAMYSPPPQFQTLPIFQTEGAFDIRKYQDYVSSPTADEQILLFLESYFRDVIPRSKLMRQVAAGTYLTDADLWRRWQESNETVTVRYIPFNPGARIPDDSVALTDAEIRDYYDDNRDDFLVPGRASVRAVVIPKIPTAADTTASLERARSVMAELEGGADFAEVAGAESSDAVSAAQGGDLGVFAKGQMVAPFDSAVFAASPGSLVGPVRSQFGYHVINVEDRWGQDSARARHVLIPVERTDDSEMAMLTLADSLEDLSENVSLQEAANQTGLQVLNAEVTEALAFVPGAGAIDEGADWIFEEAQPGDVSPLFENRQAFYALELVEKTPGGTMSLEEARPTIEQVLRLERKLARAEAEAERVASAIRSGSSFPNAAAEAGLDIREAGPFARIDFVPGLGRQNAAIGASFGLEQGEVSDPVRAANNVFLIQLMERTPADSTAWSEQKSQQRGQLIAQLQQQRLQQWLDGLKENADIIDRRAEVLQPVTDEESSLPRGGGFGF